jgi:hypothetical protein
MRKAISHPVAKEDVCGTFSSNRNQRYHKPGLAINV